MDNGASNHRLIEGGAESISSTEYAVEAEGILSGRPEFLKQSSCFVFEMNRFDLVN